MSIPNWAGLVEHAKKCVNNKALKAIRYIRVSPRMYQELGEEVFPVISINGSETLSFAGFPAKLDSSIRDIHIVRID